MEIHSPKYLPGEEPEGIKIFLDSFLKELDQAYYGKIIIWDEWNHERWDKTAGYLCSNLGYKRGSEFLEAYGYQIITENVKVKTCSKCGRKIKIDSEYCVYCGQRVDNDEENNSIRLEKAELTGNEIGAKNFEDSSGQAVEPTRATPEKQVKNDSNGDVFTQIEKEKKSHKAVNTIICIVSLILIAFVIYYATHASFPMTVTLDGGRYQQDEIRVKIGDPMPEAPAPGKVGYIFKGYYSEPEGAGIQYYDENMSSVRNWDSDTIDILYPSWEKQPELEFNADLANYDPTYADILSIEPIYSQTRYYNDNPIGTTYFICKCKTVAGSEVWLVLEPYQFNAFGEYEAKPEYSSLSRDNRYSYSYYADPIEYESPRKVHGFVQDSRTDTRFVGEEDLRDKIGKFIDFTSVD